MRGLGAAYEEDVAALHVRRAGQFPHLDRLLADGPGGVLLDQFLVEVGAADDPDDEVAAAHGRVLPLHQLGDVVEVVGLQDGRGVLLRIALLGNSRTKQNGQDQQDRR